MTVVGKTFHPLLNAESIATEVEAAFDTAGKPTPISIRGRGGIELRWTAVPYGLYWLKPENRTDRGAARDLGDPCRAI